MDHGKHVQGGRNESLGSHQTMLSSGKSHFFKSPAPEDEEVRLCPSKYRHSPTYDGSTSCFLTLRRCKHNRPSSGNYTWNLEGGCFRGLVRGAGYSREATLRRLLSRCSACAALTPSQPPEEQKRTTPSLSTTL